MFTPFNISHVLCPPHDSCFRWQLNQNIAKYSGLLTSTYGSFSLPVKEQDDSALVFLLQLVSVLILSVILSHPCLMNEISLRPWPARFGSCDCLILFLGRFCTHLIYALSCWCSKMLLCWDTQLLPIWWLHCCLPRKKTEHQCSSWNHR